MANLFLTFCWWCSSMEIIFWQTYCIDVRRGFFLWNLYDFCLWDSLFKNLEWHDNILDIFHFLSNGYDQFLNKQTLHSVCFLKMTFSWFFLCRNSGWSWQYWSHLARELCLHVDYLIIVLGSKFFWITF